MSKSSLKVSEGPFESAADVLTTILRSGAQLLLQQAVEAEISGYLDEVNAGRDRPIAIRNGYLPKRNVQSGIGQIEVRQPRCRIRPQEEGEKDIKKFSSKILPPYLRKTRSIEEVLPWLYLKGVSTGDFQEALSALLGLDAKGLSASTISRLKSTWDQDFEYWQRRDLSSKHYVYIWADGIHFNVRLGEDKRMCVLVVMGVTKDGKKELLAVQDGYRESKLSWEGVLKDLKSRGLEAPHLAIADGALGFWAALCDVYPTTEAQRCWVHKTANVLDKLPKSKQREAKRMIHNIYNAPTKVEADRGFDLFLTTFESKYPKASECLKKDRERLLAFYSYPAEHWVHIRSTNAIESAFATVRLRTSKTKGCGSVRATLLMVYRLALSAEKNWNRLRGHERLAEVVDARWRFVDGERVEANAA